MAVRATKEGNELIKIGLITIGVLMVTGKINSIFSSITQGLGISDSADTKDVNSEVQNTASPFNWSQFFKNAGTRPVTLMTLASYTMLKNQLADSFGWFSDDFGSVLDVFKKMNTQSQVAFFAKKFSEDYKTDLLTWLRGSTYPNDRLSDAEVNQIIVYVKKLPLYK